jgi:hypothetical protein
MVEDTMQQGAEPRGLREAASKPYGNVPDGRDVQGVMEKPAAAENCR